MSERYKFHTVISSAYSDVHKWLQEADRREANGYKQIDWQQARHMLKDETLLSAAAQFNVFFPAHFFKVAQTIKNVISYETLVGWLSNNPRLCIIDVGCGAGTATVAVIDAILKLKDMGLIPSAPIELYALGIDLNPYAIGLYNQMMTSLAPPTYLIWFEISS